MSLILTNYQLQSQECMRNVCFGLNSIALVCLFLFLKRGRDKPSWAYGVRLPECWRSVWSCCIPHWPVWLWSSPDVPPAPGSEVRQKTSGFTVPCFQLWCWCHQDHAAFFIPGLDSKDLHVGRIIWYKILNEMCLLSLCRPIIIESAEHLTAYK